jgi:nicotinamidase-related amidase
LQLLVIDVQARLTPKILGHDELVKRIELLSKACTLLQIPTIVTEQYPQGLGSTIVTLSGEPKKLEKTAFSCLGDSAIRKEVIGAKNTAWIVCGIESHVCVLQTVRDLTRAERHPIVVQDAISSRSLLDHNSALQEMRAMGARITSCETLLFELLQDAKHPAFKEISALLK